MSTLTDARHESSPTPLRSTARPSAHRTLHGIDARARHGRRLRDPAAPRQRLLSDGEEICGYKLGLTSAPMQNLLGVNQPDFGPVFASTVHRDGSVVRTSDFIAPRVEAEIAVVLGEPLQGPNCTPADAYLATRGLAARSRSSTRASRTGGSPSPTRLQTWQATAPSPLAVPLFPIADFDPRLGWNGLHPKWQCSCYRSRSSRTR